MKKNVLVLIALLVTGSTFAQTWSLDKAHSKLGFSVTHLMISTVDGSFKSVDAKITSSKDDFSDAVIELTAEIASVDTDNEKRDEHLKTEDFFDAAKFPTITFKSKSFKKAGDKKYKLAGDLTLHGVTKAVDLVVVLGGVADHPYTKKKIAGFKISGVIKRSDFGIAPKTASSMVSDEVTIAAATEFTKD
jgi:polyisoprenoid-binding protein YceI